MRYTLLGLLFLGALLGASMGHTDDGMHTGNITCTTFDSTTLTCESVIVIPAKATSVHVAVIDGAKVEPVIIGFDGPGLVANGTGWPITGSTPKVFPFLHDLHQGGGESGSMYVTSSDNVSQKVAVCFTEAEKE